MNCLSCPCPGRCGGLCEWAGSSDPVQAAHVKGRCNAPAVRSYPPRRVQARNLAASLWRWLRDGLKRASKAEQARRLAICDACPMRNAADRRCWTCGCFTDVKIKLRSEHCPLDPPKW